MMQAGSPVLDRGQNQHGCIEPPPQRPLNGVYHLLLNCLTAPSRSVVASRNRNASQNTIVVLVFLCCRSLLSPPKSGPVASISAAEFKRKFGSSPLSARSSLSFHRRQEPRRDSPFRLHKTTINARRLVQSQQQQHHHHHQVVSIAL